MTNLNGKKEIKVIDFYHEHSSAPIFSTCEEKLNAWKKSNDKENFFIAKDNFWTKDLPTTASSSFLSSFITAESATVINLLENEDYKLLGKSALDEFACGGTGLFSSRGKIVNPLNSKRLSGGSSSGSAFVVANKIVPFALAHDTGDSVRRPASYCGLIGFKPSYGLISRYGVIPMASSLDTVGIISYDLSLVRKIFKIIAKTDYRDLITLISEKKEAKSIKLKEIAIIDGIEEFLSKEHLKVYLKVLSLLKNNYNINKIKIPEKIRENLQITYFILCSSEFVSHLGSLKGITYGEQKFNNITENRTNSIGKWVKERILIGNYFLKDEKLLLNAKKLRSKTKLWIDNLFNDFGFLLFPLTIGVAPLANKSFKEMSSINISHWSDNLLLIGNFVGNPSINIPIGEENGMPISINIDSSWKNDEHVLNLADFILNNLKN
jgi:aspartyl-tRNA(Asn)/glutamyl-tRNA(Gln) amidotransferase subunit A